MLSRKTQHFLLFFLLRFSLLSSLRLKGVISEGRMPYKTANHFLMGGMQMRNGISSVCLFTSLSLLAKCISAGTVEQN